MSEQKELLALLGMARGPVPGCPHMPPGFGGAAMARAQPLLAKGYRDVKPGKIEEMERDKVPLVEVIMTFRDGPQDIAWLKVPGGKLEDENAFVNYLLRNVPGDRLEQLIKFSCEYNEPTDAETANLPDWYMGNRGKFYFNADVNTDAHTADMARLRDLEVLRRKNDVGARSG